VSKSLQASLRSYVQAGGKVLLSGEEIGYALVGAGNDDGTGAAFLRDVFHAQFVADNAGTHAIAPVSGSIFDDVTVHLDDGSEGTYRVVYPDVFAATDGGSIGMAYGSVGGACIVSDNTVLCGAPIEAMVPEAGRDALVQDALLHLLPSLPGDDVTSGEGEGEGEGDVGEGEGEGETRVVIPPSSLKKGGCACAQSTDSAPLWAGVVVLAAWRRRRHRARGLRAM
jgi:MYXO-CTERM domain-containing protein